VLARATEMNCVLRSFTTFHRPQVHGVVDTARHESSTGICGS
jgi:hypothetical protein